MKNTDDAVSLLEEAEEYCPEPLRNKISAYLSGNAQGVNFRMSDLAEIIVMLCETGEKVADAVELVKEVNQKMNNHEKAQKTYEALKKRKLNRERKKARDADNATALLINSKTRGGHTSIVNSTRNAGRY
jgi:hypothetical protein